MKQAYVPPVLNYGHNVCTFELPLWRMLTEYAFCIQTVQSSNYAHDVCKFELPLWRMLTEYDICMDSHAVILMKFYLSWTSNKLLCKFWSADFRFLFSLLFPNAVANLAANYA